MGFNFGVDFAGGTVVELKFNHSITPRRSASAPRRAACTTSSVQGIGSADENSFLLRMGGVTQLTEESADEGRGGHQGAGHR